MLKHAEIQTSSPATTRAQELCQKLRQADSLIAEAISLIQQGGMEVATGLPIEMLLSLEARLTSRDARFLAQAASMLSHMPITMGWFSRGVLSWGQVRSMLWSLSGTPLVLLSEIDETIGQHAERLSSSDPDALVALIDDEIVSRKPIDPKKEDRAIASSTVVIQQDFLGGATIRIDTRDPIATATFLEAIDHQAAQPRHPDAGGETRSEQRFEAVLQIFEQSLSGDEQGTRPQPRVLATYDIHNPDSMQLLTALMGCKPRISRVAADMLLCDASIVPVGFDGNRVVEVGNEQKTTPRRVRRGLEARDKGCRFPGCNAPACWSDAHHPDRKGGRTDDQYLLCRRCHWRVHHRGWKDVMHPDGTITFTRRGKTFVSYPP